MCIRIVTEQKSLIHNVRLINNPHLVLVMHERSKRNCDFSFRPFIDACSGQMALDNVFLVVVDGNATTK